MHDAPQDQAAAPVIEEPQVAAPVALAKEPKWWLAPMGYLVAGLVMMIGVVTVYHISFARKPVRLAVLDLNFIMEAKELEFTAMLSRPGVTDVERKNALALVAGIEPDLRRVVAEIHKECQCEILIKAAALTSDQLPDITKVVADRMGVTESSLSVSRAQLKAALEAGRSDAPKAAQ